MQFIDNAPVYKLVRVTGPTHNLLVLRFSSADVKGQVHVEALDAGRKCENPIEGREVLENVMRAINDCEIGSGKRYLLKEIQYMASDSRPVEVYYEMTREMIRRIESQLS